MSGAVKKKWYERLTVNLLWIGWCDGPLNKVITLEEGGGPGWVSRWHKGVLGRKNRLCEHPGGRELGLPESRWKASATGPQQAIRVFF